MLMTPLEPPPFLDSSLFKRAARLSGPAWEYPALSFEAHLYREDAFLRKGAYTIMLIAFVMLTLTSIVFVFKKSSLTPVIPTFFFPWIGTNFDQDFPRDSDKGDKRSHNPYNATSKAEIQSIGSSDGESSSIIRNDWFNTSGLRRRFRANKERPNPPDPRQLWEALSRRDNEWITALLDSGVDIEDRDSRNYRRDFHRDHMQSMLNLAGDKYHPKTSPTLSRATPLMIAVAFRYYDTAKILIDAGANAKAKDKFGRTSLHWAGNWGRTWTNKSHLSSLEEEYEQMTMLLLRAGAEVKAEDMEGQTALHTAAYLGSARVVAMLLAHGADLESKCRGGRSALHYAISYRGFSQKDETLKNEATSKLLISRGPNIEAGTHAGETPLHLAVSEGRKISVEVLLIHKADINARAVSGQTPLHIAALMGSTSRMGTLIMFGADTSVKTEDGENLIHAAASSSNTDIMESALRYHLDVEARNVDGITPLHLAVATKRRNENLEENLVLLLGHGADINIKSLTGATVLHIAATIDDKGITDILLKWGSEVNAENSAEETPLHIAASEGNWKVVGTLIKHGANVQARDSRGKTALQRARDGKHFLAMRRLQEASEGLPTDFV